MKISFFTVMFVLGHVEALLKQKVTQVRSPPGEGFGEGNILYNFTSAFM